MGFDRVLLKEKAKAQLREYYWLAFIVGLAQTLLATGGSGLTNFRAVFNLDEGFSYGFATVAIPFLMAGSVVSILIMIFVGYPVQVGAKRFFCRAPYGERHAEDLFHYFKNGLYTPVVKTMFVTQLYIFLWSLLFVIPGIVKGLEYSMVPYILSDTPELSHQDAQEYSRKMTYGYKWEIFVMQLSFIGWYFLGALACGVGMFFVTPYEEASFAQLYFVLRERFFQNGQPQVQSTKEPWE